MSLQPSGTAHRPTMNRSGRILVGLGLALLTIVALLSVGISFLNALKLSQDFQWSPTAAFVDGQNPFEIWLAGNPDDAIILSQIPNYLHALYVLMVPLGALDFDVAKPIWAGLNILLGVFLPLAMARALDLGRAVTLALLLLFLASTPFRNGVGNGQHALLVMTFLFLPFFWRSMPSYLLLGIGWVKYSFAPAFGVFYLLDSGLKSVVLSLIIPVVGWLVFSLAVGQSPIDTILQPLSVATSSVSSGKGDLMTLLGFAPDVVTSSKGVTYGVPLVVAILLGAVAARSKRMPAALALVSIASLCSVKHLAYDFVFLLPRGGLDRGVRGKDRPGHRGCDSALVLVCAQDPYSFCGRGARDHFRTSPGRRGFRVTSRDLRCYFGR